MSRLPQPGGDDGTWGDVLNDFLSQAHNADGTLKDGSVSSTDIQGGAITAPKLSAAGGVTGQVLTNDTAISGGLKWSTPSGGGAPSGPAGGDLAGTYPNPTVPGLASKATDSLVVHLAGSETITGAKNFTGGLNSGGNTVVVTNDSRLSDQRTPLDGSVTTIKIVDANVTEAKLSSAVQTKLNATDAVTSVNGQTGVVVLAKGDVGLGNVDNTSDATKNSAAASLTNKNLTSGTNAFPTFNQNTTGNAATATTANALNSASTTVVVNGATAPSNGQVLTATSGTAANWQTPSSAPVSSVFGRTGAVVAQNGDYTPTQVGLGNVVNALQLQAANNLSDVANTGTSRLNINVPILFRAKAVAVTNVASLSGTTTIDGLALVANDRVLLSAQSTASQNGPWLVQSSTWTRPTDFASGVSVQAPVIMVVGGATYAGSIWGMTNLAAVVIDTDAQTWAVLNTSSPATFTNKRITKRTGTTTSSATPTINTDNLDGYSITALAVDITSFTTNLSGTPTDKQTLWIDITDNGTSRAITWGASFTSSGTVALPTSTVTSIRLDVGFVWNTVTLKWRCVSVA